MFFRIDILRLQSNLFYSKNKILQKSYNCRISWKLCILHNVYTTKKMAEKFWTILSNLKKQGKPESWTEKTRICFKNKISLFCNQNPPNRLILINKVYHNNIDLPCPLRLYLYAGRKETKGIPVPNYIALSLVQYQDNFSVLIVTFFSLGLDIQITAIPNCRLQSSFFCHAKTNSEQRKDNLRTHNAIFDYVGRIYQIIP